MPKVRSALQLSKEFKEGKLPDCSAKDKLEVKIRQASEQDRIDRQTLTITPIRRQLSQSGEFREEQVLAGYRYQMAVEVYLTLAGCNIEKSDGDRLFPFTPNGRFDGTFEDFLRAWGQIVHSEWVDWIHNCVLEVIPTWGFALTPIQGDGETEETVIPEGEALPAEAG